MAFLTRLDQESIYYTLAHHRDNAMMVTVAVPGERWEIEFFDDGSIQAEQFTTEGEIYDESILDELTGRLAEKAREALEQATYANFMATAG